MFAAACLQKGKNKKVLIKSLKKEKVAFSF
jgi:hypothetical protein